VKAEFLDAHQLSSFEAVLPHEPIIKEGPRNTTVVVGQTVTFTCRIISDSQPHIVWLKHYKVNGSYMSDEDDPYVEEVYVSIELIDLSQLPNSPQFDFCPHVGAGYARR
jgi:hypothetical protein